MSTATAVRTPFRAPGLDRRTAMRLAETEYRHYLDLIRDLDDDDWTYRTECPAWDLRAMTAHVLGMAEIVASVRE